jgi:hypothetical protein
MPHDQVVYADVLRPELPQLVVQRESGPVHTVRVDQKFFPNHLIAGGEQRGRGDNRVGMGWEYQVVGV